MCPVKKPIDMTGIIVDVREGYSDSLLRAFSCMPDLRLYGLKNSQLVLMLNTDDTHVLTQKIQEIQNLEGVISVYPVFSRESLPS